MKSPYGFTIAGAALGLALLSLLAGQAAPALAGPATSDHDAVTAAVFDYFDGQGEASLERLERAFASETAQMLTVAENEDGTPYVRVWNMADVLPRWASGDPAQTPRTGKILSMNVVDGRLATVVFDSNGRFFDILTLAKVGDRWKIINKAFVRQ